MEDEERPGQPKKFEDEELEALVHVDCCQTQEELAESLEVPHGLKPRDVERRFCMSEMLLDRHKKKSFLHRIVTGDEKWIHYDSPKCKKSYVKPGQPAKSTAKPNIHGAKVMRCIWLDQKVVLYYELLKPGEAINGERYRTQLIRLKRAIAEKRLEYAIRHEAIIFHQIGRAHV